MKKFLLLMVSIVISVMAAEVGLRVFYPQMLIQHDWNMWVPDDLLGHKHRSIYMQKINTGEGLVVFVTDENGYRIDHNIVKDIDPGTAPKKILILGDSFLEAVQVNYNESIPFFLGKMVEKQIREKIAMHNTAVSQWNPKHYLAQAKIALKKEQYDLGIIFVYVGNSLLERREFRKDKNLGSLPS